MVLVASDKMESYFRDLEKKADDCYDLVSKARKAGFDPSTGPEIPRAKDLAERVEAQVGPEGIAPRIREVADKNDRETWNRGDPVEVFSAFGGFPIIKSEVSGSIFFNFS